MGKVTRFDFKNKKKYPTLYVVANSENAVFYEENKDDPFHFVRRLTNKKARLKEQDIVSDRPGRSVSSASRDIRHGLGKNPEKTHKERFAQQFAHQVAKNLKSLRSKRVLDGVVLVADPHFLGLLRKELDRGFRSWVKREIAREYVHGDDEAIHKHIQKALKQAA